MIIDGLTHITSSGHWFNTDHKASLTTLLASMDKYNVDMAVLAGVPGNEDDQLLLDAANKFPERVIPIAGVDAALSEEKFTERIKKIKESGFAGIKLHPRLSGVPLTHPNFKIAARIAGELDLPVMICTIQRPPLPPLKRPVSDVVYEICSDCTETNFVLIHGGYTDILNTSELIRPLEHVLLDLSLTLTRFSNTSLSIDISWLADSFNRRISIGSDFPEGDMGQVRHALSAIGLDSQKALLEMSENLYKHLGLDRKSQA